MTGAMQLNLLLLIQPIAWLMLLAALNFSSERRSKVLERGGSASQKREGPALNHRVLVALVVAELVSWAARILTAPLSSLGHVERACGYGLSWVAFAAIVVCSLALIADVMRDALEPVPSVIEPAVALMRWVASLVLGVVLLADLPLIRWNHIGLWLAEARLCCDLCLLVFEVVLIALLCANLRKLGLFVRRRSVGLALGLTMLGLADTLRGVAMAIPLRLRPGLLTASSVLALCAVGDWVFYALVQDRPRLPHALNPVGLLRTWHDLAPEFAARMRPLEKAPFIASIESQVRTVLAKYGMRQGAQ